MSVIANQPLYAAFMAQMDQKLQANNGAILQQMNEMLRPLCAAIGNGGGSSSSTSSGGGSFYPGSNCVPIPTSRNQWCPVKCDPCLFGNLELDMELYAWPLIENQLWDTDTKLDVVRVGALPLAAGGTLTLEQEARRTLQYIPDCVQIATTWTGTPQPGLLSYQWQVAMRSTPLAPVQFSNPQKGQQYECGDNCIKVPFPSYKGCSGFPIGSESVLQLEVTLDPAATSTLTSISVVVYHKKSKPDGGCGKNGCNLAGGGCGGGCG